MKVSDIMTQEVISVPPEATIKEVATTMLRERISGLPVIDGERRLVGIVTEGDLLRRVELDTEKRRPKWLEYFISPTTLAVDYVRSHSRAVANVMSTKVHTVAEDTSLADAVDMMESRHVKRLPVMRANRCVGIVTRANLLHVLASLPLPKGAHGDSDIRERIDRELNGSFWAPRQVHVVVFKGIVDLWGIISADSERRAIRTVIENVPGVKEVHDHLVWVEPFGGTVLDTGVRDARTIPEKTQPQYS